VSFVLGALLENDRYAVHFDALRKIDGPSTLGDFRYEPVLFCAAPRVRALDRQQLATRAVALRRLCAFLAEAPNCSANGLPHDGLRVASVAQLDKLAGTVTWSKFAHADFEFVNKRAYFDYQQRHVFVRTKPARRKRAVAGYVLLLHRLPDLPRKDFLDGDSLELVARTFFAKEIIERGEFGG